MQQKTNLLKMKKVKQSKQVSKMVKRRLDPKFVGSKRSASLTPIGPSRSPSSVPVVPAKWTEGWSPFHSPHGAMEGAFFRLLSKHNVSDKSGRDVILKKYCHRDELRTYLRDAYYLLALRRNVRGFDSS